MKALHQLSAPAPDLRKSQLAQRLLVLALTLGCLPAVAQRVHHRHETTPAPQPNLIPGDTIRQVVELPAATLDSLAADPLAEPAVDSVRLVWLQTPATLYETVSDRMGCIETQAPHQFNTAVLAYVRLFTERQRGYTQRVLEREQFYFPTFEKYLTQYNLPIELKYLSVVESALIPTAKSPVGALGLWQFMPPTANDLRLKRDEWVDERMHPEKATEAACKHLRYLYGVFHDWELVLAAYNWGAGNMQRVMRKTGKHSFWELYPYLPAETRNYVPTFTAIMYAMKYAPAHSLNDPTLRYQVYEPLDTLGVRGQAFDLRRLSRALGYTDSLTMGRYNPEVRHGSLPAGYRSYVLRYPSTARERLAEVDRATLLAYCQPISNLPQLLSMRLVSMPGGVPWPMPGDAVAISGDHPAAGTAAPRYRRVYYTVRRGQTVATIAEKFDVSTAQVRRWNELSKHTTVKPGRELLVLIPRPPAAAVAATVAVALPVVLRRAVQADSAMQALAIANARYAQEAQANALREVTQAKELLRAQRLQAARVAAQQQRAIFQAAALVKAAAKEERAAQLAAALFKAAAKEERAAQLAAATAAPTTADLVANADSSKKSAPMVPPQRRNYKIATVNTLLLQETLQASSVAKPGGASPLAGPKAETYTVRPGENLTKLAHDRGATIAQVQTWNHLTTETVVAGQRLRFDTAAPDAVATRPPHTGPAERPELHFSTHTVQPGDTLYNISQRFKVSVQELRRLNHLPSDDVKLKLGQKLVVQAS